MKTTRRFFSLLILIAPMIILALAGKAAPRAAHNHYLALVGTYTNKTQSKGIYAFDFDSNTGKLTAKGVAAETPDPSWVVIHPNGKFVYAANESGKQSMVSSFALDPQSGKLTLLNQLPSGGEDPCHMSLDQDGKYLFVANYTSGTVAVFPIQSDGKLGNPTNVVKDQGTLGPNKERQEGPHAHWVQSEAVGPMHALYVADLGLDRVIQYHFEATTGKLSGPEVSSTHSNSNRRYDPSAKLAPGTGPRHAVLDSAGQMYVLGELTSTVTAFNTMGKDDYVMSSFQQVAALPPSYKGRNDAAEIALHPSGKFLYTSNRGDDSIALFSVAKDGGGGELKFISATPTGGKEPRHFAIDPTGHYLLAENQNSDTINVFCINQSNGSLTPSGEVAHVPSPVCLMFFPAH